MCKSKAVLAALTLLAVVVMASSSASADAAEVIVLDFDDYSKETGMGASVTYRWAVFNNGTSPLFVNVTAKSSDTHWGASVDPSYLILYQMESGTITMTVTAPKTRDYPNANSTLTLAFLDLNTREGWIEYYHATTEIEGGAVVPEIKILGLIPYPREGYAGSPSHEALAIDLFLVLLISMLLWKGFPKIKLLTKHSKTMLDDMVIEIAAGPVPAIVLLLGLTLSFDVAYAAFSIPYHIYDWVHKISEVALIFLITWMGYKIFKDVVLYYARRWAEKTDTQVDDVLIPILEKLGAVIIVAVGVAYILADFGIDITLFVAGMGVLGLVIAFAMQESLGNFISGLILLTDRPFKVGDMVQLPNGDYCRVLHVGMRTTKLYKGLTHEIIILPNSEIANKMLVNVQEPDEKARIFVSVGVAYGTDLDEVKRLLTEILLAHPRVLKEEKYYPAVRLVNFGDSSIDYTLYFWVDNVDAQWQVQSDIREEIYRRFAEEGIEIPFPQRVVRIEKGAEL
ncbi:MAG: mechanosensitive ion channel domain-containing protein [Candidatus Thermoplasmatota archaeon]